MTPGELIEGATRILDASGARPLPHRGRAVAVLLRQALEAFVREKLCAIGEVAEGAKFKSQLLCLHGVSKDPQLARDAHFWWASLSALTHHVGYELPPTEATLRAHLDAVQTLLRTYA